MFTFKKNYFFLACILFLVELLIALFLNDRFIRPYAGDFLVVIFLYCFIRSFLKISVLQALIGVLIFSIFIEVLQLFPLLEFLGVKNTSILGVILGNTFEWKDILLYVAGCMVVLLVEKWRPGGKKLGGFSFLSH